MLGDAKPIYGFNNGAERKEPLSQFCSTCTTCTNCEYYPIMIDNYYMTTNIHGPGDPNPSIIVDGKEIPSVNKINDYQNWHIYGLEWTPTRIIWYVDGVEVRHIKTPSWFDSNIPMVVTIGNGVTEGTNANYTAKMEIDYFKYYRLKATCSPDIIETCYNFATHTNNVKGVYSLGNFCYNTVPLDKEYFFKAHDFVEIKSEFNVPLGAIAKFDADDFCAANTNIESNNCWIDLNACYFNFQIYDNGIKNTINLGGNGCMINIGGSGTIKLKAREFINLKEGISIIPSEAVVIKVENCN